MARSAIVTGATGGLGPAVARALASAGWTIVLPHRSGSELPAIDGSVVPVEADLLEGADCEAVVAAAGSGLRAVVNLVGGFKQAGRVHETPVEEFESMLRLNLRPTYLMTAAALPSLLANDGGGSIVCVSARSALRPFAGAAGYVTAKSAVLGFVAALDAEYHADGIRANAILPGTIDTPANRAASPDSDLAGWVAPEAIADVVAYLVSDGAAAVSGSQLRV